MALIPKAKPKIPVAPKKPVVTAHQAIAPSVPAYSPNGTTTGVSSAANAGGTAQQQLAGVYANPGMQSFAPISTPGAGVQQHVFIGGWKPT